MNNQVAKQQELGQKVYQHMSARLGELEYNLVTAQATLEMQAEEVEALKKKIAEKDEKIKMLEEQLNK
ncbi:hypothetical protein J26TS2_30750 [Shouchella clausii]|nr:hypothetical protein J26TS2_30750 [Shouchella clausii]